MCNIYIYNVYICVDIYEYIYIVYISTKISNMSYVICNMSYVSKKQVYSSVLSPCQCEAINLKGTPR